MLYSRFNKRHELLGMDSLYEQLGSLILGDENVASAAFTSAFVFSKGPCAYVLLRTLPCSIIKKLTWTFNSRGFFLILQLGFISTISLVQLPFYSLTSPIFYIAQGWYWLLSVTCDSSKTLILCFLWYYSILFPNDALIPNEGVGNGSTSFWANATELHTSKTHNISRWKHNPYNHILC